MDGSVYLAPKNEESLSCAYYIGAFSPYEYCKTKKSAPDSAAITSGLNPSMYKATRSPPRGIRIPKISTILSASYIKTSHFTTPIRSMHHGSIT